MAKFICPSGLNGMNLQRMQPEAVACRSIKSVILLLCEHTVGHETEVNSHVNCLFIGAIGKIHMPFRYISNGFAKGQKDAVNSSSSQEHKICHPFALWAHCRTFYCGKQSRKLFGYCRQFVTLYSTSSRGRNFSFRFKFTEITKLQHTLNNWLFYMSICFCPKVYQAS